MVVAKPLLNRNEVEELTGLSRATLYREVSMGRFPKQLKIAPGRVAWRSEEVMAWIDELEAA